MQTTKNAFLAAQAGDREAMNRLIVRVEGRAKDFAEKHIWPSLRRETSADDIFQEAYMDALEGFGAFEYREENAFLLWLCKLIHHRIQDKGREVGAQKRQPAPIPKNDPTGLSTMLDRPENAKKLYAALAQLPENMRRIVTDCVMLDVPAAEVAKATGESVDNVWQLKARAILRMKELMR